MAYKDEYEVARLYTDGAFAAALKEQFEGDVALEFFMAPPLVARGRDGAPPRKIRFGGWMWPALRLLAKGKALRGTPFDPFGHTAERRLERELVETYRARIDELLAGLSADNLAAATQIARVPLQMRGYGHVKIANVAVAKAREAEWLHRFDPRRYPRPAGAPVAGQFRGIAVTSAR